MHECRPHEIYAKRDLLSKNPVSVTRYYHLASSDGCVNVHQNWHLLQNCVLQALNVARFKEESKT